MLGDFLSPGVSCHGSWCVEYLDVLEVDYLGHRRNTDLIPALLTRPTAISVISDLHAGHHLSGEN